MVPGEQPVQPFSTNFLENERRRGPPASSDCSGLSPTLSTLSYKPESVSVAYGSITPNDTPVLYAVYNFILGGYVSVSKSNSS